MNACTPSASNGLWPLGCRALPRPAVSKSCSDVLPNVSLSKPLPFLLGFPEEAAKGPWATETEEILSQPPVDEAAAFQGVPICILKGEGASCPQAPLGEGVSRSLAQFSSNDCPAPPRPEGRPAKVEPGAGSLISVGTIELLSVALLLQGLQASTAWASAAPAGDERTVTGNLLLDC